MTDLDYPILEFDGSRKALIEPSELLKPLAGMPERCILPIYHTVIEGLQKNGRLSRLTEIHTAMGAMPVYRMAHDGEDFAIAHPGISAPLAAAVLEELIALGCSKFIACGSAGALDPSLTADTIIVPDAAVRDEGTSYHYTPPGREIRVPQAVVQAITGALDAHRAAYRVGKTWTTDAIYRETGTRIARRKSEGCLTVEMECAAFLAVAAFRGVYLGQLLAAADDVSGDTWDPRSIGAQGTAADRLFWLSVEACRAL